MFRDDRKVKMILAKKERKDEKDDYLRCHGLLIPALVAVCAVYLHAVDSERVSKIMQRAAIHDGRSLSICK